MAPVPCVSTSAPLPRYCLDSPTWTSTLPTALHPRRPSCSKSRRSDGPFGGNRQHLPRPPFTPEKPGTATRFPPGQTPLQLAAIMTGRKLGGGRILGSGKGLAASASQGGSDSSLPTVGSPVPPSDASADLNSVSGSAAPSSLPDVSQDLATNISVGRQGSSSKSGSQKLLCPICNEEMVWILERVAQTALMG